MSEIGSSYDVIVVGGGPIGSKTASLVSQAGLDVLVIEEHKAIGSPLQCAGIVSTRIEELAYDGLPILNRIKGGKIVSPNSTTLSLRSDSNKALILDRQKFDVGMAAKAVDAGSSISMGSRFIGMKHSHGKITASIKLNGITELISSRLIIGADGPRSDVRVANGLLPPQEYLYGMQTEVPISLLPNLIQDEVEIHIGSQIAPGFFSWLIPTGENVRIGLCTSGDVYPKRFFNSFMKKLGISNIKTPISSGSIPLGLMERNYADRVMLVGDAACQVKPLTGGGLVFGLMCAKHCADTAIASLESDRLDESSLKTYGGSCMESIGKEIKQALLLRKIFIGLNDNELDEIIHILGDEDLSRFLVSRGDMDFPSIASKAVFRKFPKLIKFAPHLLKAFL